MKQWKIILPLMILMTGISSNSYSQRTTDPSINSGLCVNKYDIIVDGFYGFPYLIGNIVKQELADTFGITGIRNINHIGGRVEYMIWDKVGMGVEYTYAALTMNYQGRGSKIYTLRVAKQRFLGKINFHFATSEKLDPYFTTGIGYTNTQVLSNEPGIKAESITLIPVAARIGIGLRYFFSDMVGMHVEVGLGGPLMQAGLSFKF